MHVSQSSSTSNSNNTNHNTKVYLTPEQTDKLKRILDSSIPICSSPPSPFPTLNLIPRNFLRQLLCKLKDYSIDVTSIRLNGGAASYVLVNDSNFVYRDIDILIHIKTPLSSQQKTTLFSSTNESYLCDVWTIVKYIISSCLLEHIPKVMSNEQQSQSYTHHYLSTVLDAYAKKNIKISSEQDSWALLSLQNYSGQNLELKFVEHLKRQWQFSVDSFQINLEPLLNEKQIIHHSNRNSTRMYSCSSISSITKTIKTKNLIIDAINGLTIIKKDFDDDVDDNERNDLKNSNENNHLNNISLTSSSPLRFGFFTPSSSPDTIEEEGNIECQTLATITTISTSNTNNMNIEPHSRISKVAISTINEEPPNTSLQFHLSLNDDTDDGIVLDSDDSANEDDDQVFRTPVDTNSAPPSPATVVAIELPSSPLVIEVYSGYKDLHQALDHLSKKLIATYTPETMRGGGLLKYCDLLAQNYNVYDATDMLRMQRYMCSRFFIDYKTIPEQVHVITQYVTTHFLPLSLTNGDQLNISMIKDRDNQQNLKSSTSIKINNQTNMNNVRLCLLFFDHLSTVIHHSTVCLTHHEKEATLMHIHSLKESYHHKYEYLFVDDAYHHQRYHSHPHHYHQCSSSSSNSSRSSSPSSSSSNSYRYHRHNHNHNSHRHQYSHYRHQNNIQRPLTNSSSYHHVSRNYSNDFHTNQTMLTNHQHNQRRYQS